MSTDLKRLEDGSDESLMMLAVEEATAAQEGLNQVIAVANMAVKRGRMAGKCLNIVKARTPHGRWLPLLEKHWPFDRSWATQLMRIANDERAHHFENATSIRECLRIADQLDVAEGIKRGRKRVADRAPEVEVIDNRPAKPVEDVPTVTKSFFDSDEISPEEPPPLPKTNTLHTPATRQQIDRGPEPAPPRPVDPFADLEDGAWYVYYHNNGNPSLTAVTGGDIQRAAAELQITEPDILEVVVAQHTTPQVLAALTAGYEGEQAKRVARQLRERADELDPPEETKAPTLPQMRSIIDQRAKLPPADDRHLRPPVAAAASEWAAHKMSMPKTKRYQSRTSWEACLSRMATLSLDRGADIVCDMIQRAIASGYQGWEFETSAPRNGRPAPRNTNIRTGRNFDAEMGPPINLADVEEF